MLVNIPWTGREISQFVGCMAKICKNLLVACATSSDDKAIQTDISDKYQ